MSGERIEVDGDGRVVGIEATDKVRSIAEIFPDGLWANIYEDDTPVSIPWIDKPRPCGNVYRSKADADANKLSYCLFQVRVDVLYMPTLKINEAKTP